MCWSFRAFFLSSFFGLWFVYIVAATSHIWSQHFMRHYSALTIYIYIQDQCKQFNFNSTWWTCNYVALEGDVGKGGKTVKGGPTGRFALESTKSVLRCEPNNYPTMTGRMLKVVSRVFAWLWANLNWKLWDLKWGHSLCVLWKEKLAVVARQRAEFQVLWTESLFVHCTWIDPSYHPRISPRRGVVLVIST